MAARLVAARVKRGRLPRVGDPLQHGHDRSRRGGHCNQPRADRAERWHARSRLGERHLISKHRRRWRLQSLALGKSTQFCW